jgi:hypothetical protein
MSKFEKVGYLTWESVDWNTSKEVRTLATKLTKKYPTVKKTVKSDTSIFFGAKDREIRGYYIELKFRSPVDEAVFIMSETNG